MILSLKKARGIIANYYNKFSVIKNFHGEMLDQINVADRKNFEISIQSLSLALAKFNNQRNWQNLKLTFAFLIITNNKFLGAMQFLQEHKPKNERAKLQEPIQQLTDLKQEMQELWSEILPDQDVKYFMDSICSEEKDGVKALDPQKLAAKSIKTKKQKKPPEFTQESQNQTNLLTVNDNFAKLKKLYLDIVDDHKDKSISKEQKIDLQKQYRLLSNQNKTLNKSGKTLYDDFPNQLIIFADQMQVFAAQIAELKPHKKDDIDDILESIKLLAGAPKPITSTESTEAIEESTALATSINPIDILPMLRKKWAEKYVELPQTKLDSVTSSEIPITVQSFDKDKQKFKEGVIYEYKDGEIVSSEVTEQQIENWQEQLKTVINFHNEKGWI